MSDTHRDIYQVLRQNENIQVYRSSDGVNSLVITGYGTNFGAYVVQLLEQRQLRFITNSTANRNINELGFHSVILGSRRSLVLSRHNFDIDLAYYEQNILPRIVHGSQTFQNVVQMIERRNQQRPASPFSHLYPSYSDESGNILYEYDPTTGRHVRR
ncbi:hypothetical protein ID853_18620 [Xenorhabdus sp. Vera]|uniref:hypothetical protein n=1 Tax=Xenorhabdus koppenhoeferi TaxID=351659 RepID=UPI0019859884|nr:hypothetical protein [Xenorhabdus sp. Vera]MBD2812830.1 hypothetical protein [Xenorhabdus sp. Vera]